MSIKGTCSQCDSDKHVTNSVYYYAKHKNNLAAKYLIHKYVDSHPSKMRILLFAIFLGSVITTIAVAAALYPILAVTIMISVVIGVIILSFGLAVGVNHWKLARTKKQFKTQPANKVISSYDVSKPYVITPDHICYDVTNSQIEKSYNEMMGAND